MDKKILKQLNKAKEASREFALLPHSKRILILKNIVKELRKNKKTIITANAKDLKKFPLNDPMRDRMLLNETRIEGMAKEIESLIKMPDPIGEIFDCRNSKGNKELKICKKRVPFGVIGVIYESRPNVTTDVAAICIKSGNAVILKGGKEARESYIILHKIIKKALVSSGASFEAVQFIDPKTKDAVLNIISANGLVDVIIPRGSSNLINFVRENATVPVIETGAGVCHTFVDVSTKLDSSARIIFNAKTQRPSVCNALDTLLVHQKIAEKFLPMIAQLLIQKEVEIFADSPSFKILQKYYRTDLLKKATEKDFGREFLSQKMSVKIVSDINEAIKHINKYSSKHSEAILSENKQNSQKFLDKVDAAVVYVNASTRFSDGAVFGLGSEIGISTSKLHARGPMGAKEMTTYKWIATGNYSVRK
ncbi:MAG: glutamate-5-semialdehyde dehydrogenase [Candidatus Pacebacteria bacterium]|nr:glutamate-5-semialdehyde dehydrogenase [Candidatus Paceibacterota bacterium]